MTYTQEPKANELTVSEHYDALNATDKEYAAISWGGFNLFGDRKSIKEVERLMHRESHIKPLQDRIELHKKQIDERDARITNLESKVDHLGQQLDDM
jgi:hypothetical protein